MPAADDGEGERGAPVSAAEGGRLSASDFAAELQRAANPVLTFFCILDVASDGLDPSDMEELLADQVRCDEGDLVSLSAKGGLVLLQGAREGQLGPFLSRLRTRIGERAGKGSPEVTIDVLSHPAESARIGSLLGIERASQS